MAIKLSKTDITLIIATIALLWIILCRYNHIELFDQFPYQGGNITCNNPPGVTTIEGLGTIDNNNKNTATLSFSVPFAGPIELQSDVYLFNGKMTNSLVGPITAGVPFSLPASDFPFPPNVYVVYNYRDSLNNSRIIPATGVILYMDPDSNAVTLQQNVPFTDQGSRVIKKGDRIYGPGLPTTGMVINHVTSKLDPNGKVTSAVYNGTVTPDTLIVSFKGSIPPC